MSTTGRADAALPPGSAVADRFFPSSALLWSRDPLVALEVIARHGFRGVEVWAQHLHRSGTSAASVKRRATELGLRLTAHAVSYDLNPVSQNPDIAAVSRRQVKQSLLDAAVMEAEVVVVHPGQLSSSTDDPEDYWPALLEFCADVDGDARVLGLTVGIEGMERKVNQFMDDPRMLNRLADAMAREGWANVGITADLAHLATFTDPLPAFRGLRRVVHVHLSDGDPPGATHRPLGLGRLPVVEIVHELLALDVPRIALEGRWRRDEEHALACAVEVLARVA
jgi:sugar phosphate isomerase/epimerase